MEAFLFLCEKDYEKAKRVFSSRNILDDGEIGEDEIFHECSVCGRDSEGTYFILMNIVEDYKDSKEEEWGMEPGGDEL